MDIPLRFLERAFAHCREVSMRRTPDEIFKLDIPEWTSDNEIKLHTVYLVQTVDGWVLRINNENNF